MIAELRRRHRRLWLALALALPVLFAAAMAARRTHVRGPLPPDPSGLAAGDEQEMGELAAPLAARVTLTRIGAPDRLALRVEPRGSVRDPDLLAYWCATEPVDGGVPPAAVLLGALGARRPVRLALPADARGGWILVYSLAHAERVAVAALPAIQPRGGR